MNALLRDRIAPLSVFALALLAYARALAPTVTFEDSGELITAAARLGVPHEPGYPLYTLLAHAFTALPFGTVAFRVNLLSAVSMALGAGFVARAAAAALAAIGPRDDRASAVLDACAVAVAGLLAAFAYTAWQQAVIAEVYGLNFAFTSLLLWLAVRWSFTADAAARRRILYATSFVLGLALENHPTVAVLAPALLVHAFATGLRDVLSVRTVALATLALLAGLSPWLYLPLAARMQPVLDWGDPQTLAGFVRVVMRHQYGVEPWSGFGAALGQVKNLLALTLAQWPSGIALLPLLALGALQGAPARRVLLLSALLWLAAGPVTAVLVNFPLDTGNAAVDAENRELLTVFFIPAYGVLALLTAIGLQHWLSRVPGRARVALGLATLALPLVAFAAQSARLDWSGHRWAEAYAANLFTDAPPRALVLASWDPFYFPTLYYQHVEGARADLVIVDPALLRRSWYVRSLQRHMPLFRSVEREAQAFLDAVRPFEDGEPYAAGRIDAAYLALQRALVDAALRDGRAVLATAPPDPAVRGDGVLEPLVTAYRLRRADGATPVTLENYRLAAFMDPRIVEDRLALMMRRHQGEMLAQRAAYLTQRGDAAGSAAAGNRARALLRAP